MLLSQLIATCLVASTSLALPESSPWVFFAKVNKTFVPLSGMYLGKRFQDMSIFCYGDPLVGPTEFNLESKQPYTTQFFEKQYVDFDAGHLGFGRRVPAAKMRLDGNWKVLGGPFYSCDLLYGPARGIFREIRDTSVSYCFRVDIYFLPYNAKTKSAVHPGYSGDFREVGVKPCSLFFYAKNAAEDHTQTAGRYDVNCDIYINGILKTEVPHQLKAPCDLLYYGKMGSKNLARFLKGYDKECHIYINGTWYS